MSETVDKADRGLQIRREVLGAAYVDARRASTDEADVAFERFVVENCWGTAWDDPRLSRRERSLVTLAMTGALGRMDEFELHLQGAFNNGVSVDELESLVVHLGVYCGVPASLAARRALAAAKNAPAD